MQYSPQEPLHRSVEHTRVPAATLGRGVVEVEESIVALTFESEYLMGFLKNSPDDDQIMLERKHRAKKNLYNAAEDWKESKKLGLDDARQWLGELSLEQSSKISNAIDYEIPSFLKERYEGWLEKQTANRSKSTLGRLGVIAGKIRDSQDLINKSEAYRQLWAKKGWPEWLSKGATDEELVNFLQWHNHRLEQAQNDPTIQEAINVEKEKYKTNIDTAITDGYIHPVAEEIISRVDGSVLLIGDFYHKDLGGDIGGYADYENQEAVVTQNANKKSKIEDNIANTTTHELNHLLLGWLGDSWLNEALTEHIALAIKHGKWESVSDLQRREGSHTYPNSRELLAAVLSSGKNEIPISVFTLAYSSRGHGLKSHWADDNLRQSLQDAYDTPDVLKIINERIDHYAEQLDYWDVHPAIKDEHVAAVVAYEWNNIFVRKSLIKNYKQK